jgi:myb proto-oncogene protein
MVLKIGVRLLQHCQGA